MSSTVWSADSIVSEQKNNTYQAKKRVPHFGSFYLRVGALAFGIGTMVYSGLEIGQYFELDREWKRLALVFPFF
jgi:Otopetrin